MTIYTGVNLTRIGPIGMSKDDDALRTLQNIEKILKTASMLSGNKQPLSNKFQNSQKDRADREVRKGFKAIASAGKELNTSFMGLTKTLTGLNTEVDSTAKNFGALNSQLAKFINSLSPIAAPDAPVSGAELPGTLTEVATSIDKWGSETVKAINDLSNQLKGSQIITKQQDAKGQSWFAKIFNRSPQVNRSAPKPTQPSAPTNVNVPLQAVVSRFTKNLGLAGSATGGYTYALEKLIDVTAQVTADFFQLSRIGMGSMSNLKDVYLYALEAGMSFKEYNALIKDSITVASKAGTLEKFNAIISAQDNTLASMGIFGIEARQLQANLAQASAAAGVNVNDLTRATASQVKMFDKLRKATNMTAEEFASMVSSVSNNTDAQKELVGLAPRERTARLNELVELQTIGTQFGMTTEASKQLGDALIRQRQATVKDRFEQAGALMQAAAFSGNAGAGQRLYELSLKGRRRSSDEDKEFVELARTVEGSLQSMYERGSLGTQNVVDQFEEGFGKGGIAELIDKSRGLTLAKDAGATNQEAFGKHVGEFGQAVGKLLAFADGFKNSILAPLTAAVGAALLTTFKGPIVNALRGGGGALMDTGASVLGGMANAAKNIGPKMMSGLNSVKTLGSTILEYGLGMADAWRKASNALTVSNAISGPLKTTQFVFQELGLAIKNGVTGLGTSITGMVEGLATSVGKFGLWAGIFAGVSEMFTGEISDALNPSGGFFNRVGGIVTAFFSAIPNMIFDTAAYIFGDKKIERLRNGFDMFVTIINAGIRSVFAKLFGGVADMLGAILPDDSKLVKSIKGWAEGAEKSADENFAAFDKLWDDHSATLKSVSADNKKAAEQAAETNADSSKKVQDSQRNFNNVMMASQLSSAGLISDAQALASPATQDQKSVSQPVNNKDDGSSVPGKTQSSSDTSSSLKAGSPQDIQQLLTSILSVLTELLATEKLQTDNSDKLLSQVSRTKFSSAETIADKLLNRG